MIMVIIVRALITGASSGIGYSIAKVLHDMGVDLVLVSRNKEKLETLKKQFGKKTKIIDMDLSSTYNCIELYELCKNDKIDILINNAGFGECGYFTETNLTKELNMIDLNIKTAQILTKMFLNDFIKHNRGYILNVASMAAFTPGPFMATYYATKTYILNLTKAIDEELQNINSKVYIGCLCPGPVKTNFSDVANVKFSIKEMNSDEVANYAINQMFKEKKIIIPSIKMKLFYSLNKICPNKIKAKVIFNLQKKKMG